MNKYINRLFLLIPLVLVAGACEEPDQELFSQIPRETVLGSDDPDVIAVLAASAYSPINGTWGTHNSLWSMHEVSSDEMAITQKGADWEDGGMWIRMHQHSFLPTEEAISNGWNYCYGAIGTINNLLLQFEGNVALEAELRTLRALVYLWLIDAYANVPIIIETEDDATPPNNTRQEVFDFIESSVMEALPNLRQERTYATINYYVAQTILAKLYLNAQVYTGNARWQDAADACQVIIDAGVYSLEPDFFANFETQNQGSVENIFVIAYDKDNAPNFNLAQMTLHYLSQETYRLQEQPWNGYSTLEEFYNMFDEDDARINSFLTGPQFTASGERLLDISAEAGDPDGPPLTFTPEINMLYPNALRQSGARIGKFEIAMGAAASLSNDYPIFRYADVLLTRAEALWRLNAGSTEALELVNQVRMRSNPNPVGGLSADVFLEERGREFFAEAARRTDLIRFGRFNAPWWEKPASPAFRNIFPIPQTQIDVNTSLTQNPGY